MKLKVTHGKSFTANGEPIPVGTIIDDVDEIPGHLVGKVEVIVEEEAPEEAPVDKPVDNPVVAPKGK